MLITISPSGALAPLRRSNHTSPFHIEYTTTDIEDLPSVPGFDFEFFVRRKNGKP
jgi:hypothetical protein